MEFSNDSVRINYMLLTQACVRSYKLYTVVYLIITNIQVCRYVLLRRTWRIVFNTSKCSSVKIKTKKRFSGDTIGIYIKIIYFPCRDDSVTILTF